MENYLEKMKEYLKMDSEIPFQEFTDYYNQVTGYLQDNYDSMENGNLFSAKYILSILSSNAHSRAARKGPDSKKYKKMGEKASFWSKAINFRLIKSGMSQQEIDEALDKVNPA